MESSRSSTGLLRGIEAYYRSTGVPLPAVEWEAIRDMTGELLNATKYYNATRFGKKRDKADFTENAEAALMILERTLEEKAG